MKKKTEFIKLCPFCGSHQVEIVRTNKDACWVRCAQCDSEAQAHKTRKEAIAYWNSRFSDNEPAEVVYDTEKSY